MAFEGKNLNNIAGSLGNNNLWLYTTTIDAAAAVKTVGHFDDAVSFGLRENDVMIIKATDSYFMCYVTIAAGVVTTNALNDY